MKETRSKKQEAKNKNQEAKSKEQEPEDNNLEIKNKDQDKDPVFNDRISRRATLLLGFGLRILT